MNKPEVHEAKATATIYHRQRFCLLFQANTKKRENIYIYIYIHIYKNTSKTLEGTGEQYEPAHARDEAKQSLALHQAHLNVTKRRNTVNIVDKKTTTQQQADYNLYLCVR